MKGMVPMALKMAHERLTTKQASRRPIVLLELRPIKRNTKPKNKVAMIDTRKAITSSSA